MKSYGSWRQQGGFPYFAELEPVMPINQYLDGWAFAHGVDREVIVALMVAIGGGVAGRGMTVERAVGEVLLPPATTVTVDEKGAATTELMDSLLTPVRQMQEQLRQRFGRFDLKVLKEAFAGERWKSKGTEILSQEAKNYRQEHAWALWGPGGKPDTTFAAEPFDEDWTPSPTMRRMESVIRPSFLIENAAPGELRAELARCHAAGGLVVGGRRMRIPDLQGVAGKRLDEVLRGVRVEIPDLLQGCMGGVTEAARADLILHCRPGEWAEAGAAGLLSDALLVGARRRETPKKLNPRAVRMAGDRWSRTLRHIIELRLRGLEPLAAPRSIDFERRAMIFSEECAELGVDSASVRSLPWRICWMFIRLEGSEAEGNLFDSIISYAERLREHHMELATRLEAEGQLEGDIRLAEKLLARIRQREPIRFRDLVRSFNDQRSEIYRPLLTRMVDVGLVTEGDQLDYRVGPVGDTEAALRGLSKGRPELHAA